MLRSPGRFRLPRHQDTSAVLAGQYPFLAEAGLGSAGMFIGQDLYSGSSFVYDPWVLYQRGIITAPNLILAGIVGSGKSALAGAGRDGEVPILPMVVDRLLRPDSADDPDGRLTEDGREVGHALRRLVLGDLSGLFDGPSTVKFDPSLPMVSLDLSRVTENSTLISVLMTCSSAWMEAALLDPNGGRRWVIYDEAWRLMSHPALLRRMDAHWRLARHYGLANLLVFHKLTDLENVGDLGSANRALANSLLANAETRIVYRQETDQLGPTAAALGLTGTEQRLLPGLGTGQGLWRITDRSFVVQHQLPPAELAAFDTTARMTGGAPHES